MDLEELGFCQMELWLPTLNSLKDGQKNEDLKLSSVAEQVSPGKDTSDRPHVAACPLALPGRERVLSVFIFVVVS